jgi:hypothetical protein
VHGVIDDGTLVWGQGLIDWLPVKNVRTLVPQIRTLEGTHILVQMVKVLSNQGMGCHHIPASCAAQFFMVVTAITAIAEHRLTD